MKPINAIPIPTTCPACESAPVRWATEEWGVLCDGCFAQKCADTWTAELPEPIGGLVCGSYRGACRITERGLPICDHCMLEVLQ